MHLFRGEILVWEVFVGCLHTAHVVTGGSSSAFAAGLSHPQLQRQGSADQSGEQKLQIRPQRPDWAAEDAEVASDSLVSATLVVRASPLMCLCTRD